MNLPTATSFNRVVWAKITVCVAFITGLFISRPLWLSERTFPLVPVSPHLPAIPGVIGVAMFVAFVVLLVAIALYKKPQLFIWSFIGIFGVYILFDQIRLQPWVFQYAFLLITLGVFSWKREDGVGAEYALSLSRFIIVSTYIWAGLQKINMEFVTVSFPWVMSPLTNFLPFLSKPVLLCGALVPFFQIAIGFGLVSNRFRKISLILAVAMHLTILLMLGPVGSNWNMIIWPWTFAMLILDVLLFANADRIDWKEILLPKKGIVALTVFTLFGVMPLFSFFNIWDSFLSSALYSGNITYAESYIRSDLTQSLPEKVQDHILYGERGFDQLNMITWSENAIGVPLSETRFFKEAGSYLCEKTNGEGVFLTIYEKRLYFSKPETTYTCADLQ